MVGTRANRCFGFLAALVLLPALVWAAVPESDQGQAFVEEWVEQVAEGRADGRFLERTVVPAALEGLPPGAGREYYRQLELRLEEDAPLRLTLDARPEVIDVHEGPEYLRVVLGTDPPLTFRVRTMDEVLLIDAIEQSPCVVCTEEERFVAGLIVEAGLSGGRPLLVPGLDLFVAPEEESKQPREWIAALHQRNVRCAYGRALLHGAEVVGSTGTGVLVALADRTESWPVVYISGKWMIDYSGLPEDSPVRLPDGDLSRWYKRKVVAQERLANWYPVLEERGNGTVVADRVQWFALRQIQGDLVVYTHDLGRVDARVFLLDADTGEVSSRLPMPVLDMSPLVQPEDWGRVFSGALSPDGESIAVGGLNRLWMAPLDGSRIRTNYTFLRVRAVAFSSDGQWLAVGDHRGVSLLATENLGERSRYWGKTAGLVESLAFSEDSLWVVHDDGAVAELNVPWLTRTGRQVQACCGGVRGGELDPATGELVVGCSGACEPAWMWSWDGQNEPVLRADESYRSDHGVVSIDPLGRYLVSPTADGRAALWDRRHDEPLAVFGEAPLVQVEWDPRGDLLYGLDSSGRLWRWRLASLL